MNRRRFMQGLGASAAAGVGLASTRGPVGNAEAIAPAVIGLTAAGAGAAAYDWLLRDYIVGDADHPPEGLTAGALHQRVYESARTRKSTNASTFVDNKNIFDGVEHSAYVDGKIAAIEAINDQRSQSEVYDQAEQTVTEYATTIQTNFLQGWEESTNELENLKAALDEHDDTSSSDIIKGRRILESDDKEFPEYSNSDHLTFHGPEEIELFDGSTFEVTRLALDAVSGWDPTEEHPDGPQVFAEVVTDSGSVPYLHNRAWYYIWSQMEETFSNVLSGLSLWVEEVYGDVQSGEINVEELITPRERAEMMAEDEGMAQAIADLQALNIPIDVEREATIYLPHVDATIRGTLGITQDQSIESGETYDPETDIDGSAYLTYDVSLGEGTWSAYETGVDGGEVTFTDEPWPGTTFRIHTTAGESVELDADDFTPVDSDGDEVDDWDDPDRWLVDISNHVEMAITEIDEVEYFASNDESQFETILLQEEFTVERIEDTSSGEEADSLEFSSSEPQTDDNYITQEEWDEMVQQNQDLIEAYEDSQSSGGVGDFFDSDIAGVPAALIVVIAAAAAAFGLTN